MPGLRDTAPVEWQWVVTTTLPVLTFVGGQWWTRVDGDRRERRAAQARAAAAFEQFQRETHLELQDVLGAIVQNTGRVLDGDPAAESELRAVKYRALVLSARLADPEAQALTHKALSVVSRLDTVTGGDEATQIFDEMSAAAFQAGIYLSKLLREPSSAWR